MDALIAELEQATEGSRELDRRIYKVVFRDKQLPLEERRLTTDMEYVPSYTNSLDAAITLVPDGLYGKIGFSPNRANARIWLVKKPAVNASIKVPFPALALCIAAIKARQATEGTA